MIQPTLTIFFCVTTSKNYQVVAQAYVLSQSSCSWLEIQAVPPCKLRKRKVCACGDMHWLVEEESCTDIERGSQRVVEIVGLVMLPYECVMCN